MYKHFLDDNVIDDNYEDIKDFEKYGFKDISYGNDLCNSVGYDLEDCVEYFQIMLPNSQDEDMDRECTNKYCVFYYHDELWDQDLFFMSVNNIEDALSIVLSNI